MQPDQPLQFGPIDNDERANTAPAIQVSAPEPPGFDRPRILLASLKSRRGILGITAAVLVVVLAGMVIKNLTTHSATIPSGYNVYTSPDKSFSIAYPPGWQVKEAAGGTGAEFDGPAHQVVIVTDIGSQTDDPALIDSSFCQGTDGSSGMGGAPGAAKTVSVGGQNWTQEECNNSDKSAHAAVETVTYQGGSYLLTYASPSSAFASNRSTFFSPMEGSFQFLK